MPFVVTSCASKVHRASGPGRGKPVLICSLACSLAFHVATLERSSYTKIEASEAMTPLVSLFCCVVASSRRKRGNRQITSVLPIGLVCDLRIINPRRACAARVTVVVVCVCQSVSQSCTLISHFTSHQSLHKRYHIISVRYRSKNM